MASNIPGLLHDHEKMLIKLDVYLTDASSADQITRLFLDELACSKIKKTEGGLAIECISENPRKTVDRIKNLSSVSFVHWVS